MTPLPPNARIRLVGGPAAGDPVTPTYGVNGRPDPITVLVPVPGSAPHATTTAVYFPRYINDRWTLRALGGDQ